MQDSLTDYQKGELTRIENKIPVASARKIKVFTEGEQDSFSLEIDQDDVPVIIEYLKRTLEVMNE